MAFAQIYLTQLRKFCDEEEHAVKAEKLKSNGKIYGEPNSYKMVSKSQIESYNFSSSQMIKVTQIAAYKTYSCNIDKNASVLVTVSFRYNITLPNALTDLKMTLFTKFKFRYSPIWQKISDCRVF